MNATGGLMINPYSWINAGVNLLVMEAPMGVGFSYCSRMMMKDDNEKLPLPCINSDTSTAKASRAALVDFFTTKFPELSNGPFYIAGKLHVHACMHKYDIRVGYSTTIYIYWIDGTD
jgi:carboxypeptidase C (cathepsin A)